MISYVFFNIYIGAIWSIDRIENSEVNNDGDSRQIFMKNKVVFRGFLEPQMADGFEKKWRH